MEILLVLIGFGLGLIPPWWQRRRRLQAHWCALRAEIQQCKERAETLVTESPPVLAPLYRLPVLAYQIAFPILLADGAAEEHEVTLIGRFFSQVQDINRGLDNAAGLYQLGNDEKLRQEFHRNCLKAHGLIDADDDEDSLYAKVKKIIDSKI